MTRSIVVEQMVYGSFPFWDRGYAVLARSPGCRPEWESSLKTACQRFGEIPLGLVLTSRTRPAPDQPTADPLSTNTSETQPLGLGLFATRAPDGGPWMIVGVSTHGVDDHGRPGALVFHGLFLPARDYRRAGGSPFLLEPLLRWDWMEEITTLPSLRLTVPSPRRVASSEPDPAPEARRIASALARGWRVAVESPCPWDSLARAVWDLLPPRVRGRRSLATWAFANGNQFDLVALPKLSGVEFDRSYKSVESLAAAEARRERWNRYWAISTVAGAGRGRVLRIVAAGVVVVGLLVGVSRLWHWSWSRGVDAPSSQADHRSGSHDEAAAENVANRPLNGGASSPRLEEGELTRASEALIELAERFGVAVRRARPESPVEAWRRLMPLIAQRLRYPGPWLTDGELAELRRLADSPSETPDAHGQIDEASRALRWHGWLTRLDPDRARAVPVDFGSRANRDEIDLLIWSFHEQPDPRRTPAESIQALSDALAVDGAVRTPRLAEHFPTLSAYARYLDTLPRR